jgi:hypothetical protein
MEVSDYLRASIIAKVKDAEIRLALKRAPRPIINCIIINLAFDWIGVGISIKLV